MNEPSNDPQPEESNAWADRRDTLCDRFEEQWIAGEQPLIERYLADLSEPQRHSLFEELLHVELEYKWKHNRECRRQDYLSRFPEYASTIETSQFQPPTIRKSLDNDDASSERAADPTAETVVFTTVEGHKLANFQLLQQSGTGKFGVVWKARDTQLDRFVAIKLPRKEQLDQSDIDQFLREARSAARLNHENIVRVYEVSHEDESVYIVSEFIDGLTLKERLQCGPLMFRETAELCAKLARALHHAHSNGVIHRDLKPGNVLLDREGEPHITDFGLAKREAGDATISIDGMILGTPYYMSPEQAAGKGALVNRRSDIFALGVMLYEMLTGERPFKGELKAVLHQVQHMEPRAPRKLKSAIPRDLETICLKAMSKEPTRRYATADDFAADLERYLRGEPIKARRTRAPERILRWIQRNPVMASAIGVAGAAVIVAVAGVAGYFSKPRPEDMVRRIAVTTEPPGAQITFVPLDRVTGEPRPDQLFHAPGKTPLFAKLKADDYLVVAVIDGFGFHEVIRHVPSSDENLANASRQKYWKSRKDGALEWMPIKIFTDDVVNKMTRIEGSSNFAAGESIHEGGAQVVRQNRSVPAFYVDATEFTVGAYRRIAAGRLPIFFPIDRPEPPDDHALSYITYESAVDIAEEVGKRLLEETEFEFAATAGGRQRYPWGNSLPDCADCTSDFGPVGTPEFDRLDTNPPVFGLCTNVAEWTSSRALPKIRKPSGPSQAGTPDGVSSEAHTFDSLVYQRHRVVRGGAPPIIAGTAKWTEGSCLPQNRLFYAPMTYAPGLGFRCARSLKPHVRPEDFVRSLSNASAVRR